MSTNPQTTIDAQAALERAFDAVQAEHEKLLRFYLNNAANGNEVPGEPFRNVRNLCGTIDRSDTALTTLRQAIEARGKA